MKKILFILLAGILISCGSEKKNTNGTRDIVSSVLMDFSAIEDVEEGNGIEQFSSAAFKEAAKQMDFSKGNIEELLNEAKNYTHCIIVVEDHTIVKVLDFEDCKQSGSWEACMPMVEGYIKKGDYEAQEDYMNNIIGLPDNQNRIAYLFN